MAIVSVIIPVYNGAKTVRATIESVLAQTFTDFEVIVINDGSQDNTLTIIAKISDSRLRVFSYENAGVAASRNRGVAQAAGELIAFLDADDLWTPDKLEAQFQALQENPQAAVAYSWTDYVDEQGQFLYPGSHISVSGNVYRHLLIKNFIENGSNPLIRRSALVTVGEFDPSLPPAEDWDMWLRLAARYPFVAVSRPQVLYRLSADSGSANLDRMEGQALRVLRQAFAQMPEVTETVKRQSLSNLYLYLTFKALEDAASRQNSHTAARCFWNALRYDPSVLQHRTRLMAIVGFKIAASSLLPPQIAQTLIKTAKNKAAAKPQP
jgi:glycosyltransferase involved in cell wall biosynthesis